MAAQPLTQIPASNAGVKVDEFFDEKELIKIASRLGPVQKKVLKALAQSGGKMMMQHDFRTWGQKTIAGIVGGVNAEYRALNTRKLCEALERKGHGMIKRMGFLDKAIPTALGEVPSESAICLYVITFPQGIFITSLNTDNLKG